MLEVLERNERAITIKYSKRSGSDFQVGLLMQWVHSITYLRVSLVLQVEHEKQLTHQALLRADTTVGHTKTKNALWSLGCCILKQHFVNYWTMHHTNLALYHTDTHHRPQSHGCRDSTHHRRAWWQRNKEIKCWSRKHRFFYLELYQYCDNCATMLLLTWL